MINESIIDMLGFKTSLQPIAIIAFKIGNSKGFNIKVVVGCKGLIYRLI